MKRILMTGATGFVGSFLAAALLKKGDGSLNLPLNIVFSSCSSSCDIVPIDWVTNGMVACAPRRLTFLAAEKFYSSMLWRPVMEYSGQIKVERSNENQSHVIRTGLKVLKHGGVLCIFPEGTRSRDGRIGRSYRAPSGERIANGHIFYLLFI